MNYAEFLKSVSPFQRVKVYFSDGTLFFAGEARSAIPWGDMVVTSVKDVMEAGYKYPSKVVRVDQVDM